MKMATEFAHAHIYYESDSRDRAARFRDKIVSEFGDRVRVSRLVDRPIGPHPVPMFEVDFRSDLLEEITPLFEREREGLSILVHPVSEEEVLDHIERAVWFGAKLPLKIDFLEEFMAGKVGSARTGLHR